MSTRTENSSARTRRTDVWRSNHTCMICQDLCPSRDDKDKHENQPKHKKKLLIYDFFAKEVPKFQPFSGSSVLVRRYTACGEQHVGLECLHELHFSFSNEPWWACSICYESGALMEQADMHLSSMGHITTYLDEFHSHKLSDLKMDGDPVKVFENIKRLCDEIFEEQGGEHTPPECLVMDASITKGSAMSRLAIDSNRCKPSYIVHTDCTAKLKQPRKVLQCQICRQLVACNTDLLTRIWDTHELSPSHRQAVAVNVLLEQFDVTFESGYDSETPVRPFKWEIVNDVHYGPLCGIEYLVAFRKGNFCELCGCAVGSVEKHFSCENHIMQFLTVTFPIEMFRISQYASDSRRKTVMGLTSSPKFRFGGGLHKRVNVDWFPPSMEMIVRPEIMSFPSLMPELSPLGTDCQCLFCPICWLVVSVPKIVNDDGKALWTIHCSEQSHFDFAIRRACFGFDEKFFVPMSSTVPKAPRNLHGKWIEMKEGKEVFHVQTQADVGLEFVIDDQENQEVVCILCAQWFARGMDTLINNHIRSYDHLHHYLHVANRNLLSMLRVQKTEEAGRELMLEWLQRSVYNDLDEMRLYSPEMALRMRRWGNISIRKVDATAYDSVHRPVFQCIMEMIDEVAKDDAEKTEVSIKDAMAAAAVKIHSIKQRNGKIEKILCRCTQCEMAFSTTIDEIVSNIWDRHLSSEQHFRRFRAFMSNKLDMLGFAKTTSTYSVKPFVQQDPSRKVTWQWNAKEKTHEFVLSVIGLEDLVERHSSEKTGPHQPDFFCRLCAIVIPRRAAPLEAHVRSARHVLCYVHKYHPQTIMELDMLPKENGKEMRRLVAQLLKDHKSKEPYCIPVYDPIGEQERKGILALQTAKDRERQRALTEARKHAQEQRKKMDEERRKQREFELEREKARQAQKEKELRERNERLLKEKIRTQKILDEAKRKAEEERKTREIREAKEAEEAERKRRQDELRLLLDQEKQRLKTLHEKEATQRRLMEEKEKLERKMKELKERGVHKHKRSGHIEELRQTSPHVMTPPIGVVNAPQLRSFREPLLGAPPPNMRAHPVPFLSGPYNGPERASASSRETLYNGPSAPIRETFDSFGPKPMFPEFVPVANKVPIYTGMEEAEKAIRLQQPKEHQVVIDRPSLRDRKVDPYILNPKIIQSRDQLVDFLWRQGAERIPAKELPTKFNEKAAGIEGALGIDCLYEVICSDCSDLDTFYCSMCGVWTTPNDMFKHLETTEHKLAYLFRNYKMYHQTVVSETNSVVRTAMLSQFAIQIWKMEKPPGQVSNRLRSLLDRATIERIWPDHVSLLDQSWKDDGKTVGRVDVPPPVSKTAMQFLDSVPSAKVKGEPRDEDAQNGDKHDSRAKDKDKSRTDKNDSRFNSSRDKDKSDKGGSLSAKSYDKDKDRSDRNGSSRPPTQRDKDADKRRERGEDRRKDESSHTRKRSNTPELEVSSKSSKGMESKPSASPDRKRRRSRSPEKHSSRDHKQKRSRSANRSSRRSIDQRRSQSKNRNRSRSRTRKAPSGHVQSSRKHSRSRSPRRHDTFASSGMSWEETAAAFLAKLGDSKAAASVLDSSRNLRTSSSRTRELEEKLEQLRNLAKTQPATPVASVIDELLEGSSDYGRAPAPSADEVDEKAQMRKLLGVLITMQQEAERSGRLDESIINKLYREVGLKQSVESSSDQLLAQLCSQVSQCDDFRRKPSIDLQAFGIGVEGRQETQSSLQPTSSLFGDSNRQLPQISQPTSLQTLLAGVRRSLESLNKPTCAPSPLMKPPYVITKRDDVFPESETRSYVFPGADSHAFNRNPSQSKQKCDDSIPASTSGAHLTKKEKAALRRKQLLEEAERLRKEAEEEDDDEEEDDWDCLAEVISKPTPNTENCTTFQSSHKRQQEQRFDNRESRDSRRDLKQGNDGKKGFTSIAPGQKMPLARTILPDGKPTPDAKAKQNEKEREKRKAKQKEAAADKRKQTIRTSHGTPCHWPQPVPQPLLGVQLDSPHRLQQQQSDFQQPQPVQMPGNESNYCSVANAPAYSNQYLGYSNPPPQQLAGASLYFHGQQFVGQPQQSFVASYDVPPVQQPPQQFYGQQPFYG